MTTRLTMHTVRLTATIAGTERDVSVDIVRRQALRGSGAWRTTRTVRVPAGSPHNLGPAGAVAVRRCTCLGHVGDFADDDAGRLALRSAVAQIIAGARI